MRTFTQILTLSLSKGGLAEARIVAAAGIGSSPSWIRQALSNKGQSRFSAFNPQAASETIAAHHILTAYQVPGTAVTVKVSCSQLRLEALRSLPVALAHRFAATAFDDPLMSTLKRLYESLNTPQRLICRTEFARRLAR